MSMLVNIRKGWRNGTVEILFMEERGREYYIAEPVEFKWRKIDVYEAVDTCTISLGHFEGQEFLKAMAEALDENGVKTDNDNKIAGLLEAKKEHLADMRKLVFKEEE